MRVLLDTDICIHVINRRPGYERVLRRVSGRSYGEIALSAVTVSELRFGVAKSAHAEHNWGVLESFLATFELLDYPVNASLHYAMLRTTLERQGVPIGNNDLLIAAHTLDHGASLVTNNAREFRRVAGLKVLDWLK